jgi:hypothetical protein
METYDKATFYTKLRDSAVCMAVGYVLGIPGIESDKGEIFRTRAV